MKDFILNGGKIVRRMIPKATLKNWQHKVLFQPVIDKRGLMKNEPPPLFKVIFFELRTKCNGSCGFCPANIYSDIRDDIIMPFELFENAINQLHELNFNGRIAFFNNSDPLIVPEIDKYIRISTSKLGDNNIYHICTNGLSMTQKKGEAMLEAGANRFSINVYNDNLKGPLPKKVIMFQEMVEKFNKGRSKPVLLEINKRLLNTILYSKSGDAPNKPEAVSMDYRGFCLQPFTRFPIDPDGIVSLCCMDAFISKKMGDIKKDKLIDIWEGEAFQFFRQHLLNGDRARLPICNNCDYFGVDGFGRRGTLKNIFFQVLTR